MKFRFLDKERELRYSLGDIMEIQERFKGRDFNLVDVAEVALVGLRRDDPDLTKEALAAVIDMETFPELLAAIRQASGFDRPKRPTGAASSTSSEPSPATTSDSPTPNSAPLTPESSGASSRAGKKSRSGSITAPE